nr:aminoglycoside 6-adenylyltransferase [Fictibacillus phosphorivorans]
MDQAITKDLTKDPNVLAFFYGGSIAKGDTDLYSDIDLRIVVKDERFEAFRQNKKERAKRWGEVLFFEDFPWASHTVTHYSDFVKVDSFYYKEADLKPSLYLKKEETKIMYDPYKMVERIVKVSQSLSYQLTEEDFEIWRGKFFAYMHEVYRGVKRQEFYYALRSLDMLRWSIAAGWDMEADRNPNSMGVWSKYEGKRSVFDRTQLSLLESWHSDLSPVRIMKVVESFTPEFKRLHSCLCNKLSIKEDTEWINEMIKKII